MKTLSNETLTISVKEHGAELASIVSNGREYLWQADEAYWKRHSPVLFPIVGAVWNSEYKSHGQTYKLGQHGFARDMDFTLLSETDNEVSYVLTSNEETKKRYPYDFRLVIGYRLVNNRITVLWHVENTGTEQMAFQIGAHPAFFWPLLTNETIAAGVPAMDAALAKTTERGYFLIHPTTPSSSFPLSVITEGGCVGATSQVTTDAEGYLPLTTSTFDNDALIIEDSLVDKVTICRTDKTPYLSLQFTSPLIGLWSPPKKNAPFVCIEPWYGRTDAVGYDGTYEDRQWINTLAPGSSFDASYDIIIEL